MKQKYLVNSKGDERGIAGQARKNRPFRMKINILYIKSVVVVALVSILGIQTLWLYNMYISLSESTLNQISNILSLSIDTELAYRLEHLGGPIYYQYIPPNAKDTAQILTKTITIKDTTFVVPYNRNDIYGEKKINQLVLKSINPLDINRLDSIFHQELIAKDMQVEKTAISLYDKKTEETVFSDSLSKAIRLQRYETEMVYVDIQNSIGVKAYVQMHYYTLFQKIALQLVLSAVLIIAVVACLFRLLKTIFRQRKEKKLKQDLVDTMVHELKKPISTTMLILDYITGKSNTNLSSSDELLSTVFFEVKRLASYVEKIQEISRGEAGNFELNKEPLALDLFFQKLKEKYEAFSEKQVRVELQLEAGLNLNTDIVHFSNIIENLMENSIKYSDESVFINICVSQEKEQLQIIHRDNGWGIAKSEIDFIFDKFYRSRMAEKRRKPGFGLGLSYVQLIVKNLGGDIFVHSEEKKFTEFTLLLDNK